MATKRTAENADGSKVGRPAKRSAPHDRLPWDIARELGGDIVGGKHQPGSILPGEVAASDRYHVSRPAYREAVRILASKGLVESRPKIGTRVTPRGRWNLLDPDIVEWFFMYDDPDPTYLRGLFELRRVVEPAAASMAAQRRTEDDMAQMRVALAGMDAHHLDSEAGQLADRQFHEAILAACHNEVLLSLSAGITAAVLWTTLYKLRMRDLPRNPVAEHHAVFDAIEAGDAGAAETAMRTLVDLALQDTQAAMFAPRG